MFKNVKKAESFFFTWLHKELKNFIKLEKPKAGGGEKRQKCSS